MHVEPLGAGPVRTFTANFDTALQAAESAFVTVGLQQGRDCRWAPGHPISAEESHACSKLFVERPNDHTAVMYAHKPQRGGKGWMGGQARVEMQESAPNQITVRVLSKYRIQTIDVGQRGDYSEAILSDMARRLK